MNTNIHPAICLDCRHSIPAGSGLLSGSRYICAECAETRQALNAARRYQTQVVERIPDPEQRWMLEGDLSRLALRLGSYSAMILQAVLDRVEDLVCPTYLDVMTIAREERKMLGV